MNIKNRITNLLDIRYPVIQAGMVWVSGWKLASAVSNCGGLGMIGAGSMKPDILREHIINCRKATNNSFAVNLPLLRGDIADLITVCEEENIKIVFSSAGHPGKYIERFKNAGMKVVHVVSSVKQGLKSESVGCDAVVGEGFEAGGHNGADELTTLALIPQLSDALNIPVIGAGGIVDGRGILAVLNLGAEAVQIGTRFAATIESSAHSVYKQKIVEAKDTDTVTVLKKIGMARLFKNKFSVDAVNLETSGAEIEKLRELLGRKREMMGIFEGNIDDGMMEAGQGAGLINDIPSVEELFTRLTSEFDEALNKSKSWL